MAHPKNKTGRKSLDRMARDPRIDEIWHEGEDGYFANLVRGYNWDGCSSIHEYTIADLYRALSCVEVGRSDGDYDNDPC